MAKKSYNKINCEKQKQTWLKLLEKIKPHSDYEVTEYYGVSLLKTKRGGQYSIKLIHNYETNSQMSQAYFVDDFQRAIKIITILEWFAQDDGLRPEVDDEELDLDAEDTENEIEDNDIIDF